MNYEQKYKDALERASKLRVQNPFDTVSQMVENIFPELQENKDERIRKEIIDFVKSRGGFKGDWIAWLEKQGENKSVDKPKFKVGDWITDGHLICKVLSVTGKFYELHLYNDDYCHFETDVQSVDKRYHLWTIADTKDGDVLVGKDDRPFIFTGEFDVQDDNPIAYCGINSDDKFITGKGSHWTFKDGIKPATKEQRDLLFQKMKEEGYGWDADKKELKKMEVVSKESEDERIREQLCDFLRDNMLYQDAQYFISWLDKRKSDDEVMKIRRKAYSDGYKHGQDNIAIFLGKESIEALEHFVKGIGESGYASPYDNRTKLVYRLLEQLKQIVK